MAHVPLRFTRSAGPESNCWFSGQVNPQIFLDLLATPARLVVWAGAGGPVGTEVGAAYMAHVPLRFTRSAGPESNFWFSGRVNPQIFLDLLARPARLVVWAGAGGPVGTEVGAAYMAHVPLRFTRSAGPDS